MTGSLIAMGATPSVAHNVPLSWEGDVPGNVTLQPGFSTRTGQDRDDRRRVVAPPNGVSGRRNLQGTLLLASEGDVQGDIRPRIIPFWVDRSLADQRAIGHPPPEPAGEEERRGDINGDTGQGHVEEIGSRPVRRRHGHRHGRVLVRTHPAREHIDLCHQDHRIDEHHHHHIEPSKRNTDGGPERVGVR